MGKAVPVLFQLFSKRCEYVLRVLLCLGCDPEARRFRARDICKRANVPEAYSRKVFQSLVQGGFLRAVLGPGGGYELTRDPSQITLLEVIRAVDGDFSFDGCLLGHSQCGKTPCVLHGLWGGIRQDLLSRLNSHTLLDLVGPPTPKRRSAKPRAPRKTPTAKKS